MQQLFLDANTYLGFYYLTPSEIHELTKLVDLLRYKKINLLLPGQVEDEVRRNRETRIEAALKPLADARLQVPLPALAERTTTGDALKKSLSETNRARQQLLTELLTQAENHQLPADRLVSSLMVLAQRIPDKAVFVSAAQRKALGNPPGKGQSLGDALNWEAMLATVPLGTELCFVSADRDFASPLDDSRLHEFLLEEWTRLKGSRIHFYREIKSFFQAKYPDIHLSSDVRKYFLIDELVNSPNFMVSHDVVGQLLAYESFTLGEAQRILTGGMENSQVRWLAQDPDVVELLEKILGPHGAALPKSLVDRWRYVMSGVGHPYGPAPTEADVIAVRELST
jgi:hypothetical protein